MECDIELLLIEYVIQEKFYKVFVFPTNFFVIVLNLYQSFIGSWFLHTLLLNLSRSEEEKVLLAFEAH